MKHLHESGVGAIDEAVGQAKDLRDLARRLGIHVLESRRVILDDLDKIEGAKHLMEGVRVRAASPELAGWPSGGRFLDSDLVVALRRLLGSPDLATLALLQGLCTGGGPLDLLFRMEWGAVDLQRGDPFPIPPAPPTGAARRMPHPRNTARLRGPLMEITDFEIHQGGIWPTVLEFGHKETLDHAVWAQDGDGAMARPTRIGVVYPFGPDGLGLPADEVTDEHWFGVWPREGVWSLDQVADALGRTSDAGCEIVLLPEMSLPHPDALATTVAEGAEAGRMPALVVAGSAQLRTVNEDGTIVRTNESAVYLNGSPLLRHRKLHPFQTDDPSVLSPNAGPGKRSEWLSTAGVSLRIAMGRRSRLAVLICADVLDSYIHSQLIELQVNVVLVPSLTLEDAGYDGLADVANLNQAIVVIANGALAPFALMCLVPDAGVGKVVWSPDSPVDHPYAAVFDPANLPDSINLK